MDTSTTEHNANSLREQIKNGMLRVLIETFELKLAALQAKTPPSRLQKPSEESLETIEEKLRALQEDLNSLSLWCQGCQRQIDRALTEIGMPATSPQMTSSADSNANDQVTAIFKTKHS